MKEKATPFHAPFVYDFESRQVRTITDEDGNPWWVAKDVCDVLGYTNHNKSLNDHCKGVTNRYPLWTPGGVQETRIINEPDLYRLIAKSTRPEAVRFEQWIFEEVLPSIRKTGGYATGDPMLETLKQQADRAAQEAKKCKEATQVVKACMESASALKIPLDQARLQAVDMAYQSTGVDYSGMLPQPDGSRAAQLLNDILNASVQTDDGDERIIRDIIAAYTPEKPGHAASLHKHGLKLKDAGSLFIVPHILQENLLADTQWADIPIRNLLIQIPGATAKQKKLSGERAWGVVIPIETAKEAA